MWLICWKFWNKEKSKWSGKMLIYWDWRGCWGKSVTMCWNWRRIWTSTETSIKDFEERLQADCSWWLAIHMVASFPHGWNWKCPSSDNGLPNVNIPLSTTPIVRLLSLSKIALISSLLVIAGGMMALHNKTLTNVYAGCPIVVCLGPPETGNTTAIKAALSVTGKTLGTATKLMT